MREPSFTGFGKRPDFTPAHQVDLLMGKGPAGANMEDKRNSAVEGWSAGDIMYNTQE